MMQALPYSLYGLCFYLYSNLCSLYPTMPPLIGFLFILYKTRETKEHQDRYVVWIFICLLLLEAIHQEPLGFLILLFILYEELAIKRLLSILQEHILWNAFHILAIYVLYFTLLSSLHNTPLKMWDYLLFCSVVEFVLWRIYAKS